MARREILQLGNPALRVKCSPVVRGDDVRGLICDLLDTLHAFRAERGFGRGIAAPQLGSAQRVIVIDIERPVAFINPVIVRRSRQQMTLWDDCFSFPDILVKVNRSLSIDVRYQDEEGKKRTLRAESGLSELLQHEIDHLNGILAIDRAVDSKHIVFRSEYERWVHRDGKLVM